MAAAAGIEPDEKKDIKSSSEEGDEPEEPISILFVELASEKIVPAELPFDRYFELFYYPESPILKRLGKHADQITMVEKMRDAAPFNIFYNSLKVCEGTEEQLYSIKFTDLLCPSFGKLKCSLLMTFHVDIAWLIEQYAARKLHHTPITVLYGFEDGCTANREVVKDLYPNIKCHYISVGNDYGCQHTKCFIFFYEDDSLRIVIGSANIYSPDWCRYNQQIWVSPRCPKLPSGSSVLDGESRSGFKLAFLDFLYSYRQSNIECLKEWEDRIKTADLREIKVSLIFGCPGVHSPRKNGCPLHYVGHLLSKDCIIPDSKKNHSSWGIVAHTGSMGLLGKSPEEYLYSWVLKSLGSNVESPYLPTLPSMFNGKFSLVYPSIKNALDTPRGAGCCCYLKGVRELQPWLNEYTCVWKADKTKRSKAISQAKCYFRISPCLKKLVYFYLTSSNLSRSGWGAVPQRESTVRFQSFELGLLFLPKYFEMEHFEIADPFDGTSGNKFPVMFDLPLTPYGPEDESYCLEVCMERGLINSDKPKSDDFQNADQPVPTRIKIPTEEYKTTEKKKNISIKDVSLGVKLALENTFFPTSSNKI